MKSDGLEQRWEILPGPKWSLPLQARTWLIGQRHALGWSQKDVAEAFFKCAVQSDLYLGPGGGARFDRATEKRVARFEREGRLIPDWVYWLPLAMQHAQVTWDERWEWECKNIPGHRDPVRQEEEEAPAFIHLDDSEIALIARFRRMDANERDFLLAMAEPKTVRWWMDSVVRAAEHGIDLVELLDGALQQPALVAKATAR